MIRDSRNKNISKVENVIPVENVSPIRPPVRTHSSYVIDDDGDSPYIEIFSRETTVGSSGESGSRFAEKQKNERLKKLIEELLQAHSDKHAELQAAKAEIRFLKEELEYEKSLTAQEKESKETVTRVFEGELEKWYSVLKHYRCHLNLMLKRERGRNEMLLQTLHDLENLEWFQSKDTIIERFRCFLSVNSKQLGE